MARRGFVQRPCSQRGVSRGHGLRMTTGHLNTVACVYVDACKSRPCVLKAEEVATGVQLPIHLHPEQQELLLATPTSMPRARIRSITLRMKREVSRS
jgi:hypothetical protein